MAGLGKFKHQGRTMLVLLVALGATITGFALSKWLVVSCILVFFSFGGLLLAVFATTSSLVQMITSDNMRGRVMSVYNVAFRWGCRWGA